MSFVGREKELTWLSRELNRGRNITITGKYGMGKTSLVRELSKRQAAVPKGSGKLNFIFLDFFQTPGELCLRLQKELSIRRDRREMACLTYRQRRSRIAVKAAASSKKHIVILDNITSLTSPKLSLIRYFILERSFQFIALADASLSEREFFLLRSALLPAGVLAQFQQVAVKPPPPPPPPLLLALRRSTLSGGRKAISACWPQ